jgi:pSer/pThr/pTyr-binding forkhead associated (FHA) protein
VNDEENNYQQKFSLTKKTINIGNRKNPDNHIGLMDSYVSKVHGRIFYDEARRLYFFEDLGSRNGSWLNGNPMTKNNPQIISNGDRLRVGKTRIRVTLGKS